MLVKFQANEEIEKSILHIQKRLGEQTVSKTVQLVLGHYNELLNKYQEKCNEFDELDKSFNDAREAYCSKLKAEEDLELIFFDEN